MESFGARLKESRENQNYTLDQVARDTRISKRYLQALEQEDFTVFPGEAYLTGFLRNYTEYLGLDPEEFIALYRNMRIQEQPIPMDELIHGKPKPKPKPIILPIAVVVGVLLLGGAGFFLYRTLSMRATADAAQEEVAPVQAEGQRFVFDSESETRWFQQGDVIEVALGDQTFDMEITSVEDNVSLSVPGGMVRMEVSETRFLDLNLDARNDLKVVFNDLDRLADVRRANLWLIKTASLMIGEGESSRTETATTAGEQEGERESGVEEGSEEAVEEETGPPPLVPDSEGRTVVLEAETPRVFEVEISFRGNCLFRYLLDGEVRDQRFYQKGESFTVDNVKQEVVLWISNAGALRARVEDREVNLGRPGQVVTKAIRWTRDASSGRYQLEIVPIS